MLRDRKCFYVAKNQGGVEERFMKSVSNEFLGALFGAWVGIVTELWKKPPYVIGTFILLIVVISLLLSTLDSAKDNNIRWSFVVLMIILTAFSGVFFTFVPIFKIFGENQLTFYYILLISWLLVGILLNPFHKKVKNMRLTTSKNTVKED